MKKIIFKVSLFIIIFSIIFSEINNVFLYKSGHRSKLYQGLYTKIEDDYDVLLMGSSHMNGGINPNILWNEYGITSFNYATGGQPIDVTYYLLKEALKTNDTKVVVLDVYYLGLTSEFGEEGYIRYVLDNMKFSKNKIEAVMNCTPKDEWLYYLIPFFKYHSRWKELSESDYRENFEGGYYTKGFGASQEKYGKENMTVLLNEGEAEIPEKTKEFLYKFIQLSKEENFELILVNMPYDYTSTTGMPNWITDHEKMYNTVEKIAIENNIPFINYNNYLEDIGFDFKEDMYNIGHLNVYGSAKVTLDLGDFIINNYDLGDKREYENYIHWNEGYEDYIEAEKTKYYNSLEG